MIDEPRLSAEELACFSELFSSTRMGTILNNDSLVNHLLTVTTEVPQVVASILGKAKLTLLAEVGPYKLWFPLQIKADDFGLFQPTLGVPEVLDVSGIERSWRLAHADDVWIFDHDQGEQWPVESLSSSGMAIRAQSSQQLLSSKDLQLQLPNGETMRVDIKPIRREKGLAVVKFEAESEERDALRQFLFNHHRSQHANLYSKLS
ncbi:hypothetical protein [Shewanella morhuae]|uniref:PilZ domain-containing protein n=1 Tax=Shewanella morhuae TaxID=365591 RepID=A0A380AJI4_9GAMM|nr:hypothetical protein [Shewanella morhuae]GIU02296.1 hypothetical protein TUM4641_03230 [Shewanella morhuae]SUI81411.1 Uncharacterised protein [Shewanella morhuae]